MPLSKIANQFYSNPVTNGAYGIFDGLNLTYSMFKYGCDISSLKLNKPSADLMHEWMLTTPGICLVSGFSIFVISNSFAANLFDENDPNRIKRFFASWWSYVRDIIKSLKNAFKGLRSTIHAIGRIFEHSYKEYLLPLSLVFGILSAINQVWMRYIRKKRKVLQDINKKFLKEILSSEWDLFDEEKIKKIENALKAQKNANKKLALCTAAFGGIIFGLYLYMGLMGITALSTPIFTLIAAFGALCVVFCIITRVYEEWDFQQKLTISQIKIKLALSARILETAINNSEDTTTALAECQKYRNILLNKLTGTYVTAFLKGLKDGLAAYSAVSCLFFSTVSIYGMLGMSIPPVFVFITVITGALCLITFVALALSLHHKASKKYVALNVELSVENFSMKAILIKEPVSNTLYQEWVEVIRSFFSGIGKGQKAVDYTMNPCQELDKDGHYHDTSPMFVMTIFQSVLHAISFSIQAFAKKFSDCKKKKVKDQPNFFSESSDFSDSYIALDSDSHRCTF